jgi:hypothetical protein
MKWTLQTFCGEMLPNIRDKFLGVHIYSISYRFPHDLSALINIPVTCEYITNYDLDVFLPDPKGHF